MGVEKPLAAGKKRKPDSASEPKLLFGKKAAQAMVEQLIERATGGKEEIGLAAIDPIWKYRWLLSVEMMQKLNAIKMNCTTASVFKIRKARAIANGKQTGGSDTDVAIPDSASAAIDKTPAKKAKLVPPPARSESSTSLAGIKSPAQEKKQQKKKLEPENQPKLRFFSTQAAPSVVAEEAGQDVD